MEALPITPEKASHQPAKPQARHEFGDLFEVLLHEATLRLPARPADLPSIEIHRTTVESERKFRPDPFASAWTDDRDRGSHLDARLSNDDAETIRESAPESAPETSAPSADDDRGEDDVTPSAAEGGREAGETFRGTDGDVRTTEDESGEPTPEAAPAEDGNEAAGSTVMTGLPGPAQQAAAEIAAANAQALGKGEAALLARAAAQPRIPASAAEQAQLATGTAPSAAARLGANGAASHVEVTPAAVVAQPNAALGGGAAAAALANQTNTTPAAAQTGQAIAANPTTAAAAQLENRSSGGPGGNAPGGQTHPGAGETTAQGIQGGDARVQRGPTASASALAASPEPGAVTNASIQTVAEQGTANPRNAQTQTAQSQGAPVLSGETVEAAAERTAANIGLPQSAQAQKSRQALPTTGAANTAAKAMDRAVTPAPVQPTEGSGSTSASPSGAGAAGLMQAAARISAMMPAQTRPAAASPVPLDQVVVHIHRAAATGQNRIRIRLHPAELGQIDVKLKLAGDGFVKAIVTVDRPETFELLQRDARGLEKALQDAGLKTDSGSLSFNLRGQAQHGSDARRGDSGFESQGPGTDPDAEPQIDPKIMAAANAASPDRLLDMRV